MRIISGKYGKRRFQVPTSFKARPTTDFAKENLFNVINNLFDLEDAESLDLFSGTGSIAFELLSRGSLHVTAVEQLPAHAAFIEKVARELKEENLTLVRGDVFRFLMHAKPHSFDFIFADPPYSLKELGDIPRIILEKKLLRPDGLFIIEHPKSFDFSALPGFHQHRVYGSVNFSIFLTEAAKTDA